MSVLVIDLGGSATKLAELEDGRIAGFAEAPSPVRMESLFDRDGQYSGNGTIRLERVEKIVLTGAGSSFVTGDFRGIPTVKTDEFAANAAGAREMTGLETMVVVSIGTGTSFVSVKGGKYEHIGGLAIGGGTFSGLSGVIFGHSDMGAVAEMSGRGDAANVDLLIGDISGTALPGLPVDVTAANFGKARRDSLKEDVAAGLANMVLQAVGSSANFVARGTGITDFVMIGNMVTLPQSRHLFDRMGEFYGLNFIVPEYPGYVTAIGAAILSRSGRM